MMAMVAPREHNRSTLNPNAPEFVPAVYRQVEDFSPEWWDLVKTSTWFRDYWLTLHPEGSFDGSEADNYVTYLDLEEELEAQFEELVMLTENNEDQKTEPPVNYGVDNKMKMDVKVVLKDLSSPPKSPKERIVKPGGQGKAATAAKYQMKAHSPRRIHHIHQPR